MSLYGRLGFSASFLVSCCLLEIIWLTVLTLKLGIAETLTSSKSGSMALNKIFPVFVRQGYSVWKRPRDIIFSHFLLAYGLFKLYQLSKHQDCFHSFQKSNSVLILLTIYYRYFLLSSACLYMVSMALTTAEILCRGRKIDLPESLREVLIIRSSHRWTTRSTPRRSMHERRL